MMLSQVQDLAGLAAGKYDNVIAQKKDLRRQLELAIDTLRRSKKGSDKTWIHECKQRVAFLRSKIGSLNEQMP